jgi:hypothetical protein
LPWYLFSDLVPHAQSIVSARARIPGEEERFLDPRSKTSFLFDHLSLVRPLYSHHIFRLQSRLFRRKPLIHKPMNPTRQQNLSGTRCVSAHGMVLIRIFSAGLLWKLLPCNTFLHTTMMGRCLFLRTPITRRPLSSRSLQTNTIL